MNPPSFLFKAIVAVLFAVVIVNVHAQAAFTEIINPRNQPGRGFGWSFGGLPDLTQDGVGEFYVVESSRVYVYDGSTLTPRYWVDTAGGDIGHPTCSAGDSNADGIPELMLGKVSSGQLGQVSVVDGKTGAEMFTLNSPNPINLGFFGDTLRLLPDMTGDGREDWLIHQPEFTGSVTAGRVYIFDSQTRQSIRTLQNTESAHAFVLRNLEVIPDVDGDDKPELLSGNPRGIVRSLQTGQVLYELQRPNPNIPVGVTNAAIEDINGDGLGDIATGSAFVSNSVGMVFFFSGKDGKWLRTLYSPNPRAGAKFGKDISVLPDLNNDSVPELWVSEDGVQLTYVFDGATSVLLKTVPYPGVFNTLFFTGVVRQQAVPGIRAYLFASEFVNNSEGRVYFMPFTPIQSTQVRVIGKTTTGFRLQVSSEPGLRVEIEATSDLKTWERVTAVTTGNQPTEAEDSPTNRAQRFYRTVQRK